jgi:hypothetical protein
LEQAIKYAEQGLQIAREINARDSEAWRLWDLGRAYAALGEIGPARQHGQQAFDIFEALKFPQADEVRDWLAGLEASDES